MKNKKYICYNCQKLVKTKSEKINNKTIKKYCQKCGMLLEIIDKFP